MKYYVVVDIRPNAAFNLSQHGLPEYLSNPYSPGIDVPLWKGGERLPGALRRDYSVLEVRLAQVNDPVPVPCDRVLIPCCCCHPSL